MVCFNRWSGFCPKQRKTGDRYGKRLSYRSAKPAWAV